MNKLTARIICLVLCAHITSIFADDSVFCLMLNKVAIGGQLESYSDKQIENGLCMTAKEIMSAITTDDSFKEKACTEAAQYMMEEYKKRFPDRPASDVTGKC